MQDISEEERLNASSYGIFERDFVANISHELKTPIGAMVLLAETLYEEEEPNLVKDLSNRIAQEAQRLAGTIDDLSALSQIEHGSQESYEVIPTFRILMSRQPYHEQIQQLKNGQYRFGTPALKVNISSKETVSKSPQRSTTSLKTQSSTPKREPEK